MEKEISIGVSNRHIHLSKETYDKLFDTPAGVLRELTQPGMFVTDKTVTLLTDNYKIENVKLLGPLRDYDQVEISHNDALKFKIDPPVRASGEVEGASQITIKTDKAEVTLPCAIIAERHIHISASEAESLNLHDKQKVQVRVGGIKSGIMDAHIKVSNEAYFEMHIDTDDANAFIINNDNNKGTLIF
ncbi:MAG: propanediol utilization protein [Bacilli bacterium]|nr:propanediol utilization protein [Bacilli bacterium]